MVKGDRKSVKEDFERFWNKYVAHFSFWGMLLSVALYCIKIFCMFYSLSTLLSDAVVNLINGQGVWSETRLPLGIGVLVAAMMAALLRKVLKLRMHLSNDIRLGVVESVVALVLVVGFSFTNNGLLAAGLGALLATIVFCGLTCFEREGLGQPSLEWIADGRKCVCILGAAAYVIFALLLTDAEQSMDDIMREAVWNQIALSVMFEFLKVGHLGFRAESLRAVWPDVPKSSVRYTMEYEKRRVSMDSETVHLVRDDGTKVEPMELYGYYKYEGEEYAWLLPTFFEQGDAHGLVIVRCPEEERENQVETVVDPAVYGALYDVFKDDFAMHFNFVEPGEWELKSETKKEPEAEPESEDANKDDGE